MDPPPNAPTLPPSPPSFATHPSPAFHRWRTSMSFFIHGPASAAPDPVQTRDRLVGAMLKPPPKSVEGNEAEAVTVGGEVEVKGEDPGAVDDVGNVAQREQCEKWVNIVVKDSPLLHFLIKQLNKQGCPFDPAQHFRCAPCDKSRAGGFSPDVGVVLCQNVLVDKRHVEETLAHELIHAFDHCTTRVDWTNCRHYACSEVRASSLSTECGALREWRRGHFGITKGHQACVKRRAALSVRQNPYCSKPGYAERIVEEVFGPCFADTAPFDEIYP